MMSPPERSDERVAEIKATLLTMLAEEEGRQVSLDPNWVKTLSILDQERARMADVRMFPENNADLHSYLTSYLGLRVPDVSVCEEHCSPFSFIADPFFERENFVIAFANRNGGKTINAAALHHANMWHKDEGSGFDICAVGAIKAQAQKALAYLEGFSTIKWFHPDLLYSKVGTLGYRWGSYVQVLTGSTSGVNSPHPICAAFDEVELMAMPVLEQAYSMPLSKNGYAASMIMTSTRKYMTGTMQAILHRVENDPAFPFVVYPWCIFEVLRNCGKEKSCELCKRAIRLNQKGEKESFFDICQGRGRHSNGFYSLIDVLNKFTIMQAATFDAEWLCLRPGQGTLVFPNFRKETFHQDFQIPFLSEDPEEWKKWECFIIADPGWTDPFAILFVGRDRQNGNLFVFDEFYSSQTTLKEIAAWLRRKYAQYHLTDWRGPFRTPYTEEDQMLNPTLWVDEHAAREIGELYTEHGIRATPIACGIKDGIQATRPFFDGYLVDAHPGLFFHIGNVQAVVSELGTYSWKIDKMTGKPTGEMPASNQPDHGIDLLRYLQALLGNVAGVSRVIAITAKGLTSLSPRIDTPTTARWARQRRRQAKRPLGRRP